MNHTADIREHFIQVYPVQKWKRYGFFTDQFLLNINEHWLQFEPQNKIHHYILAVLYIIIMNIGLIGNLLVLIVYIKCKSLQTSPNYFIINLIVSDLLMVSKMPIFIYNSFCLGPALGDIVCQYYGFIGGLSGTSAICTLTAIAVDRYNIVKYPLSPKFTRTHPKICILICWLYSITFAAMPLIPSGRFGKYVPEGFLTSCSFDYLTHDYTIGVFIVVFFVAAWVLPFMLITFSYTNILFVVKNSQHLIKMQQQKIIHRDSIRNIRPEQQLKQELKLTFIALQVILLWFIAWTPYSIVALIGVSNRVDLITPTISMLPAISCKIVSCIDPFIYALSHPKFKEELRKLFRKKDNNQFGSLLH